MCEKVKLTQEQADAIETLREGRGFREDAIVEQHVLHGWDLDVHKCLTNMANDTLIRALYIGYEVEPQFKVGDFVKNDRGRVAEILEDKGDSFIVGWIANGKMFKESAFKHSILRHATKQEIWWAEHGRGDWELHRGDVIVDKRHSKYFIVTGFALDRYYMQPINYIDEESHPYQTRLIDDVKDNFKVAFFVEDRKDA